MYLTCPVKPRILATYFDPVADLLSTCLVERKQAVLVHCTQGASRSVALVMAYLIKYQRMSVADALTLVQSRRKCAQPNDGFMMALQQFADGHYLKIMT